MGKYSNKIQPHPILNDEKLFQQFIEAPLDENNILFQYCDSDALQNIDNILDL